MSNQGSLGVPVRRRTERCLDSQAGRAIIDASLLVVTAAATAWIVYFALSTMGNPYPIEYREGASPVMTQFLLEGRNPYALENQPLGTYQYGFVYPVVVLPFAAVFGNGLYVHRAVTAVFIVLSAILIAWLIIKYSGHVVIAIACGLLSAMAVATRGGLGAFPSSLGTFLFMASLMIAFVRSFDRRGLLGATLLSLAAFYTKPYFLLALALVISYTFLFVSKQRAVMHGLLSAAALLVSFLAVQRVFPMYFVNVLVTSYLDSAPSMSHMLLQLDRLRQEFYPVMFLALLVLLAAAWRARSQKTDDRTPAVRMDFRHPGLPLLGKRMSFFGFVAIGSTLAFVLILGPHTGQYMTYAYQLMLPPFLIWLGLHLHPEGRLLWLIVPALILNIVLFAWWRQDPALLQRDKSGDWARLYQIIDGSSHVLNSPPLTAEIIRQGRWPADSGQSEYYFILSRGYAALGTLLGPNFEDVRAQGRQYLADIRGSVRRGDYDLITLPLRYEIDMPSAMGGRYHQTAELHIEMPQTNENFTISVWMLPGDGRQDGGGTK